MQEHPVPQNVLEIEFKLFGNFSVREFTKILLGCAAALGVYILNLPAIVTWPVIIIVILYGIGSAMIKNFDAKANTILSAILVSPRYIWRKNNEMPDYLARDYQKMVMENGQNKAKESAGIAVRDLEVDELIRTRTQRREQAPAGAPVSVLPATAPAPVVQDIVAEPPAPKPEPAKLATVATPEPTPQPIVVSEPVTPPPTESEADLVLRLNELRGQLIKMQKVGASKAELDVIMQEIDNIYKKLKVLSPDKFAQTVSDNVNQVMNQTNFLYGIVVDRKDRPVAAAKVKLVGSDNRVYAEVDSQPDGRFETPKTIPYGSYAVEVTKGGFRFDKFKVVVSDKKLPAYKFRSK